MNEKRKEHVSARWIVTAVEVAAELFGFRDPRVLVGYERTRQLRDARAAVIHALLQVGVPLEDIAKGLARQTGSVRAILNHQRPTDLSKQIEEIRKALMRKHGRQRRRGQAAMS